MSAGEGVDGSPFFLMMFELLLERKLSKPVLRDGPACSVGKRGRFVLDEDAAVLGLGLISGEGERGLGRLVSAAVSALSV